MKSQTEIKIQVSISSVYGLNNSSFNTEVTWNVMVIRRPKVENFLIDVIVKSQGNTDFRDSAM